MDFAKRDQCKPGLLLRLSLAGNLEKTTDVLYTGPNRGSVAMDSGL
jgi:hypothetical protein